MKLRKDQEMMANLAGIVDRCPAIDDAVELATIVLVDGGEVEVIDEPFQEEDEDFSVCKFSILVMVLCFWRTHS